MTARVAGGGPVVMTLLAEKTAGNFSFSISVFHHRNDGNDHFRHQRHHLRSKQGNLSLSGLRHWRRVSVQDRHAFLHAVLRARHSDGQGGGLHSLRTMRRDLQTRGSHLGRNGSFITRWRATSASRISTARSSPTRSGRFDDHGLLSGQRAGKGVDDPWDRRLPQQLPVLSIHLPLHHGARPWHRGSEPMEEGPWAGRRKKPGDCRRRLFLAWAGRHRGHWRYGRQRRQVPFQIQIPAAGCDPFDYPVIRPDRLW